MPFKTLFTVSWFYQTVQYLSVSRFIIIIIVLLNFQNLQIYQFSCAVYIKHIVLVPDNCKQTWRNVTLCGLFCQGTTVAEYHSIESYSFAYTV